MAPTDLPKPLLRVEKLSFSYGRRAILRNVSLTLSAGEILHIRGANGAGKTTLVHLLAGILRAAKAETLQWQPQTRFVFLPAEGNGLFADTDATTNLKFWRRLSGRPAADADITSILKRWGLGHVMLRQGFAVKRFSTGMKRRLGLARVTASGARVWVLDEPLQGLDTAARKTFHAAAAEHVAAGGAILLVSHELENIGDLPIRHLDLMAQPV